MSTPLATWRAVDCSLATSNKWKNATNEGRVLWLQLLMFCDNYGAAEGDIDIVWARMTKRLGWTKPTTSKAMQNLAALGLLHVWKTATNDEWLHIVDFDKHQHGEFLRKRGIRRSPKHDCSASNLENGTDNGTDNGRATNIDLDINKQIKKETMSIREVFEHWATVEKTSGGITKAKLTEGRRKRINARLNEGYTVEQLCRAIDGFLSDAFHLGKNDRKTRFTSIDTVLRSGDKVEAGILLASKPSGGQYAYLNGNGNG